MAHQFFTVVDAPGAGIHVQARFQPRANYALALAGIPLIQVIRITNTGAAPLEGLTITVALRPIAGDGAQVTIAVGGKLAPSDSAVLDEPAAFTGLLAPLTHAVESTHAVLEITVETVSETPGTASGTGKLATLSAGVDIDAFNEFRNTPQAYGSLAPFVQPNARALTPILKAASDLLGHRTKDSSLQGYQEGPPRAALIAAALYEALHAAGLNYVNPPASFENTGQKIRTTAQVLGETMGTCVDLAVLYAAALEAAGLFPVVFLTTTHAFAGFYTDQVYGETPCITDANVISNLVGTGAIVPVELTLISKQGGNGSFKEARKAGLRIFHMELDQMRGMVDITKARLDGVRPMPIAGEEPTTDSLAHDRPFVARSSLANLTWEAPVSKVRGHRAQVDTSPARFRAWKRDLVDLSLRNPLLNLPKNRKVIDILLPQGLLPVLDDLMHQGTSVRLLPADAVGDLAQQRGITTAAELNADVVTRELTLSHALYTLASGESAWRALRTLRRESELLIQETGSNYLFLTLGALCYPKPGGGEARAPLFLLPVRLAGGLRGLVPRMTADAGAEAVPNLCLVQWLASIHALRLPELSEPALDDQGLAVTEVFGAVRRGLLEAGLPFRVEESAALAILKFSTFQMWRDLDANWQSFMDNPVVEHLVNRPGEDFRDPVDGGTVVVDETRMRLPIPADGSQLRAIARAEAGQSFVLQGPPGTGKSQTIANLIAYSLAQGRTVLFVAEKQAALEVVSRRLEAAGMGPFCLDLHGSKQAIAAIRGQLRTALEVQTQQDPATWQATDARLQAAASVLGSYPARVHSTNGVGQSLWGAYDALGALGEGSVAQVPLAAVAAPAAAPAPVSSLAGPAPAVPDAGPAGAAATVWPDAEELQDAAIRLGLRPGHPWLVVGVADPAALDTATVARGLAEARGGLAMVARLSQATRALLPAIGQWQALRQVASVLRHRADPAAPRQGDAVYINQPSWSTRVQELDTAVSTFQEQHASVLAAVLPEHLDAVTVPPLLQRAQAADAGWFLRGRKRRALALELAPHLRTAPEPETLTALLTAWHAALEAGQGVEHTVREQPGLRLGAAWHPWLPDAVSQLRAAVTLARTGAWAEAAGVLGAIAQLPETDIALLEGIDAAWDAWMAAVGGTRRTVAWWLNDAAGEASALTGATASAAVGGATAPGATPIDSAQGAPTGSRWLDAWAAAQPEWERCLDASGTLEAGRIAELVRRTAPLDGAGLQTYVDQVMSGQIPTDSIVLALRRGMAATSLTERSQSAGVGQFDALSQDHQVDQFVKQTAASHLQAVTRLPAEIAARRPFEPGQLRGEVAELGRQLERKRGGMTFRELVRRYPEAITKITPCFLMSPGSVAHYLDASSLRFDLVIFDEASQIRVPQAIGAMGRGKAVVVVGDSKQMPPTRVMEVTIPQDGDAAGETEEIVVGDLESILTEAVESGLPQEWLAWHYRSRDESLIAFSNREYYDGRLVTFPQPREQWSVHWRRVQGTYDRGGARTNPVEAQAIVDEIATRLASPATAGQSIGVVTFNIQQRDLITTLLEESTDLNIRQALEADAADQLFVKNLENVQGDERDTIIFSLAFSPDPDTGVLPLNFGPLNLEGGERRLNVAVTRARDTVVLFSSFDPAHIDLRRSTSKGIADLRAYLEYAAAGERSGSVPDAASADPLPVSGSGTVAGESQAASRCAASGETLGSIPDAAAGDTVPEASTAGLSAQRTAAPTAPAAPGAAPSSRLAAELAGELRARGLEVACNVGLSSFTVDLALRRPGAAEWQVAVMLDSPQWNSRPTIIDRDGAPQLLHGLMGWPRVERVWLPGWLRGREEQLDRLVAAVDQVDAGGTTDGADTHTQPDNARRAGSLADGATAGSSAGDPAAHAAAGPPRDAAPEPPGALPTYLPGSNPAKRQPSPAVSGGEAPAVAPASGTLQGGATGWGARLAGLDPVAEFTPAPLDARYTQYALSNVRAARGPVAEIVPWALGLEGPISLDRLVTIIIRVCDYARVGAAKRAWLTELVRSLGYTVTAAGGDVVWPAGVDPARWRTVRRSANPDDREFAQIPLQEVAAAMLRVVTEGLSATQDDLWRETVDVLGYTRQTSAVRERLALAQDYATRAGLLSGREGRYYPGS